MDILDIFHIKFLHILPITLSYNTLFAVLFGKIDNSLIKFCLMRRINMNQMIGNVHEDHRKELFAENVS